jgi:tetratricopeptide (TPR) repeat protein
MLGATLAKLGLTLDQQKLLAKVFKISLAVCIGVAALAWVAQSVRIKMKSSREQALKASPTEQLTAYFEKKSRDLLPVDIEAHEFAAHYYLKNDQPQKAIDHILRILPLQKANRALQVQLATAYLQSAQYRAALDEFTKLGESDTADEYSCAVAARAGLTLFYVGKIRESLEALNACVAKYPRCAEAMCYEGEVEAATATPPINAESYFKKALEMDPGYVEAWYQRARFCMSQGDYVRGREYLLKILEIEPLNAKTHARLGMVYYYLNDPEMAKKAYQTALALNPNDFNTHYNLGELYYSKYEDNAAALAEFKKTLEGNPLHGEANFRTGVICLSNNMIKESIGYLEKAREASPKNVRVLLQLAVAYERIDMKDEALNIYRLILDFDALNQVARQKVKLLSSG